jgi:drug/metabolite transporter (DMT)-like permease
MTYGATTTSHPGSPGASRHAAATEDSSPPNTAADDGPQSKAWEEEDDVNTETTSTETHTLRHRLHSFYTRNIGLVLVFLAQTFGSIMSTAAKLLTGSDAANQLHALQIIFVRMLFTTVFCMLYMWWKRVPDWPLGPKGVRGLLVFRGLAGFVGLFGLYCECSQRGRLVPVDETDRGTDSLMYLEISDATAITFLVPTWTALVCYIWLRVRQPPHFQSISPSANVSQEPYHTQEALSGLIALIGVLLIARPAFIFGHEPVVDPLGITTLFFGSPDAELSPIQRTLAVLAALLITVAAAIAYATIRVIGPRAHSLVSVNYFAVLATIGSAVVILVHPDLHFVLPQGVLQWVLLVIIGISGFLLQFLLTEGLQREKGGRATNMIYVQMVFALIIERVIWGTTPPVLSLFGSAMIVGSAVWVSLQQKKDGEKKKKAVDEESRLLGAEGRERED